MSRRRKKLPESPLACSIESLSHEGRGIAHHDGKTLFVDGGLPGERVQARYINRRRKHDELSVEDNALIENPHPERTEPPCVHARVCGGCALQHVNPEFQILHKQQVLLDQLQHFGKLQPEDIALPLTSMELGYRTKARLGVRYVQKYDEVLVGFRERHSNFVTRIEQCDVLVPAFGQSINVLKTLVHSLSVRQRIPQIEVAAGDKHYALVIRHMDPLTADDIGKLIAFSEDSGLAIYLQSKGPETVQKLWPEDGGDLLSYHLPDYDLRFEFHPNDFTQVNPAMNQSMVRQALAWLAVKSEDKVLDLFCGLGNFTLPLARSAKVVTGVEGSVGMVERGYHNARLNHIKNVEFLAADLHLPLIHYEKQAWVTGYDKVLLDPPRSGAEEFVKAIHLFQPPRLVYVSCNPATLARDAGLLVERGYKLQKVGVLDMFPHTTHVESMALFSL